MSTMFTGDPLDALVVAHERGRELRAEAAAERLRGTSRTRRAIAVSLRRAADRLDLAPLARRSAPSPQLPLKER
jgi:hypothetical protein